jgi:hypothetical protein
MVSLRVRRFVFRYLQWRRRECLTPTTTSYRAEGQGGPPEIRLILVSKRAICQTLFLFGQPFGGHTCPEWQSCLWTSINGCLCVVLREERLVLREGLAPEETRLLASFCTPESEAGGCYTDSA